MSMKKSRRIWKTVAVGILTFLLVIVCVVLTYTAILYGESRLLLNEVQAIKVGGLLDAHTVEVAKEMRGIAFIGPPEGSPARYEYFYVDPSSWEDSRYAAEFTPVPFERLLLDLQFPKASSLVAHCMA